MMSYLLSFFLPSPKGDTKAIIPSSAPSSASILDPLLVSVSVKWRSIQASAAHSQGDLLLNVPVHLKMKQRPAAFAFVQ